MRTTFTVIGLCLALVVASVRTGAAQALQITNGPRVEHADSNSAVIAWSTNANAGTVLRYGTDPNHLTETATMPWGGLTHRVTINNLQPNTAYYFQAFSAQGQGTGTSAISIVSLFRTANGPGPVSKTSPEDEPDDAQVVVGPIPQKVTANSAQLYWETSDPTQDVVKYGMAQNALDQTVRDTSDGPAHHLLLNNLQPNTAYYFAIETSGGTTRANGHFQTPPSDTARRSGEIQITGGPNVEGIKSNTAKISWSTNVGCSSVVEYGADANLLNQVAQAPWNTTNHTLTLANLNPNTKYYFQIQTRQGPQARKIDLGNTYSFQTLENGQSAMAMH